MELEKQKMK